MPELHGHDQQTSACPGKDELQNSNGEVFFNEAAKSVSEAGAGRAHLDAMGSVKPVPAASSALPWFVYILRCSNDSLYTGITTDVEKRLGVHNEGKGSAYVRAHRPARLVAFIAAENRSVASILECRVKALSRARKLALAKEWKAARPKTARPRL